MITSDIFKGNEDMRRKLGNSMDIIEVAYIAWMNSQTSVAAVGHDALAYSMAYAKMHSVGEFMSTLRQLANLPIEHVGTLEAAYMGVDPFEEIALQAEQEHLAAHPRPTLPDELTSVPSTKSTLPKPPKRK